MRPRSVRFRITAVATAALALVLVAAGLAVVLLQRNALITTIDQGLTRRADDLQALLGMGAPEALAEGPSEGFAQLVADDGAVTASTPNLAGAAALPLEAPAAGDSIRTVSGLEVDDDRFRVLSRRIPGSGILHVAATFDIVGESAAALTTALAVTIPVVVLALAGLIWWLVGRTLRPVENIRAEVAAIGSADLDRRVPAPGTGDEIDRLAGTMNRMLDRLEASIRRQQRFVADASHELRSPLTRMRSALEVGLAAGEPASRESLESLLDDVVEMQHTAEDLLYLARSDEGAGTPVFAPLDLDVLVLRETRRIAERERVAIDASAVSAAHVSGDAAQLTRLIRNLLDNAERHAAGMVTVALAESAAETVLRVGDDGPGIPPEDTERVFERFSVVDEARTGGGAGLGLAIARDIARAHGGTLEVAATAGPGATLELRLPVAP